MGSKSNGGVDRRHFLRAIPGGSAAAAAAVVTPIAATDAQAYDPGREETKPRYREDAPGVQAFYRTNGYETLKK